MHNHNNNNILKYNIRNILILHCLDIWSILKHIFVSNVPILAVIPDIINHTF